MRPEDRARALTETASRAVEPLLVRGRSERGFVEHVVNDTLYHERRRLDAERRDAPRHARDITFYKEIARGLRHGAEADYAIALSRLARHFSEEIAGNLDERVYRVSTGLVPAALGLMLRAARPSALLGGGGRPDLSEHVQIEGEVEHVKRLHRLGTLVVVPTHSSHLDSVLLGWAVHRMGLPPLLYGAGLNLFENPLISFFMNRLGAYRVDRKKQATLYKDTLKEYATVALEYGYDNLFFPGGTRSRSGAVERKLKRGLLGTGVTAFVNRLRAGRRPSRLYVVPCTISYKLVLEAETLVDDHLKEVGKARYVIDDDESRDLRRVLGFLASLISLDSRVSVRWSKPLDLFGNDVDEMGQSLDPRGRVVDPASYVTRAGVPTHDPQRDAQYTTELAQAIGARFLVDNTVMSTHVVGYAVMRLLADRHPDLDLWRLLRTGGTSPTLPVAEVASTIERTLGELRRAAPGPRLAPELSQRNARTILDDALRHFGTYHTTPAAVRDGEELRHLDRNLLHFYGNRLSGYGLRGAS